LATGFVSAILLWLQTKHDASQRAEDRRAASDLAHQDRTYANLMKVQ